MKKYLESGKVEQYICGMATKSIRIASKVHKEVKIYVANNEGENITDFVGFAVMTYLKQKGHKFSTQKESKTKKP